MAKPKQPPGNRPQAPAAPASAAPKAAPAKRAPVAGKNAQATGTAKSTAANGTAKDTPANGTAQGTPANGTASDAPAKTAPAKGGAGKAAGRPARPAGGRTSQGWTRGQSASARSRTAGPVTAAPGELPVPRTVKVAVWLMYAGAALSALDLIATLFTVGSARSQLRHAHPSWTAAQLSSSVGSLITGFVISWVITILLWLVMARTNQVGRGWARNVATVLCVISTLSFALYVTEPGSVLGKAILVPMWLVGVAAAVLLWLRDSTAYIRANSARPPAPR